MDDKSKIGRLAMREEGDYWNAYFARVDTMAECIHLGAIRMKLIENPSVKIAFLETMRESVRDLIETAYGERPSFGDIELVGPTKPIAKQ